MLTKNEKSIASSMARDLLEEGMIWGEELEEYAKLNAKNLMVFKSDEHYLEFENHLLGVVEKIISKNIIVEVAGDRKVFNTFKDAAKNLGVSEYYIYSRLKKRNVFSIEKNGNEIVVKKVRKKLNLI